MSSGRPKRKWVGARLVLVARGGLARDWDLRCRGGFAGLRTDHRCPGVIECDDDDRPQLTPADIQKLEEAQRVKRTTE